MQRICIHRVRTQTLTFNHIHTHTHARAPSHTHDQIVFSYGQNVRIHAGNRVFAISKCTIKLSPAFSCYTVVVLFFFGRMEGLLCLGSQARVMLNMTADWWTFVFNVLPLNSDENVLSSRELLYLKLLEALWFRFFFVGLATDWWRHIDLSCLCVEKAIKSSDRVFACEQDSKRQNG